MQIIVTTSEKDLLLKQTNRVIIGTIVLGLLGFSLLPVGIGIIFIVAAPIYLVGMAIRQQVNKKKIKPRKCPHCSENLFMDKFGSGESSFNCPTCKNRVIFRADEFLTVEQAKKK